MIMSGYQYLDDFTTNLFLKNSKFYSEEYRKQNFTICIIIDFEIITKLKLI